jgi:phospholipid/cholesterol/gamma-HCH transport system substrate-binding protein
METRAHHVLIGFFTVLSALAAISFAIWMSSSSTSSEYRYYTVLFKQAVTGLSRGSAVQFSGIRIGDITELTLDKEDPRKVRARIRIDPSVPIKESTVASLSFTGITGNSVIELSHDDPNSPPLQSKNGEDPVIYAKPSPFASLLANGEDLMTNINKLIINARDIFSEENVQHLSQTLEGLHQATDSISNPDGNLQQLLVELKETSRAAKAALEQSNTLIANADRLVTNQGAQTLSSAEEAMASVAKSSATLEQILVDNQASFSSGMQGLGQLDPAINELRSTLSELRLLTRRLQDDPARFLLGRDNKQEFQP